MLLVQTEYSTNCQIPVIVYRVITIRAQGPVQFVTILVYNALVPLHLNAYHVQISQLQKEDWLDSLVFVQTNSLMIKTIKYVSPVPQLVKLASLIEIPALNAF